jgi:hypothetical protein
VVFRGRVRSLRAAVTGSFVLLLACAPPASATTGGGQLAPLGLLGLPSLHSIIEAIANGFFSALAGALVPGFLKHGTVATIQHLVALPDPAGWGHVGELESDMTYLGMSLMPVTVTVCTLRYWMMGLTGAAHPVSALARCAWATGVLVIYRWLVEQTVAATNTITHAILGLPVVADGLASIITVLFGGALLLGAGGVFGAFLVIVGVVFAAALFASAEALTVLLALVFCAGPPFIALAPIPELSHLARVWSHALMAIVLVPIGWTILFAAAGALTLDATGVTHGAGGLPGHFAAAFAGLITFILAVKLPMMLFGELRHILGGALRGGSPTDGSRSATSMPGTERMRAAHARLRSFAVDGMPALGRSAGRAAGAIGAPEGGPFGAARRGLAGAARRTGLASGLTGAVAAAGAVGGMTAGVAGGGRAPRRSGAARERLTRARAILAGAPGQARAAMAASSAPPARAPARRGARSVAAPSGSANAAGGTSAARMTAEKGRGRATVAGSAAKRASGGGASSIARPGARAQPPRAVSGGGARSQAGAGKSTTRPGRKVTSSARRDASAPSRSPAGSRGAPPPLAARPPKTPPTGSKPSKVPPPGGGRRRRGKR